MTKICSFGKVKQSFQHWLIIITSQNLLVFPLHEDILHQVKQVESILTNSSSGFSGVIILSKQILCSEVLAMISVSSTTASFSSAFLSSTGKGFTAAFILKACSLAVERAACWCYCRVALIFLAVLELVEAAGGRRQGKTQHACRACADWSGAGGSTNASPPPCAWPGIVHGLLSAERLLFKTDLVYFPRPSLLLSHP